MGIFGGNTAGAQSGFQNALLQMIASQQAQDVLAPAYNTAKAEYGTNYYEPYSTAGASALDMYKKGLGLGGPQGTLEAQNTFKTGPGYDFALGQGVQALDRSAAGKGMFGSGNNAIALTNYGQGAANQEYDNWLARLQGLGQTGLTAAAGQTGRQGALAGLDTGLGNAQAGIITGTAQNAGNAISQGQMADQQANMQGQSNLFSAILGGANLGAKAYFGPASFATKGA